MTTGLLVLDVDAFPLGTAAVKWKVDYVTGHQLSMAVPFLEAGCGEKAAI